MLPCLPFGLQQQPLGTRIAAYTASWTVFCLLMQYGCHALVQMHQRWTGLRQASRAPIVHWATMFLEAVKSYAVWVFPMAVLQAYLNPGWSDWSFTFPNYIVLGYWCLGTLMAYDCYSYFLHRWMHMNKTAFNILHSRHHASIAALDVNTASYMAASEGCLVSGIPFLLLFAAGWSTGNWWYFVLSLYNALYIVIMGHCGHELDMVDFTNVGFALANPFVVFYLTCPCHAVAMDHEIHHKDPRTNFAFFFTFWDDLFATSKDKHKVPHCTLLVLAAHAVHQALFVWSFYLFFRYPLTFIPIYIVANWVVSPAAASAVADALCVPEVTRRLFGSLMDVYRRDCSITYEPAGMPGSFDLAVSTAAVTADMSDTDSRLQHDQRKQEHPRQEEIGQKDAVYIFGCHPTGLLSRGAFCTFAARGWRSPVAKLPRVRMAIGSQLLRVPMMLIREALLAMGCCPADANTLRRELLAGTSIAITPGGWKESRHLCSYNLILQKRLGFVALAVETGAQLVPVLCLGEQDLVGPATFWYWWVKYLACNRPMPVRVVFGPAMAARDGESVVQLHARYIEALLAMGKQHGVQLQVVE